MLPVSGALQLKARDASGLRPMISQSGAYSRLLSPAPYSSSGRKRFQSPISFALARISFRIGGSMTSSPSSHLLPGDRLGRVDVLVHEALELLAAAA